MSVRNRSITTIIFDTNTRLEPIHIWIGEQHYIIEDEKIYTEDYTKPKLEELRSYARVMGCKTEIEFTMFLKVIESISNL